MALINLIAVGNQDRLVENRATRQQFDLEPQTEIGWGKRLQYKIERHADVINKVNLSIKVGPAPEGYRWKRCWPLHFVKNLTLDIGGRTMWETNSESLRMKYLIDGLKISHDWSANAPFEMLQTPPECIFDYNDEERTRLSTASQEVFFEPLRLNELIHMQHKLPILALQFHEVYLRLETNTITECLEPIGDIEMPVDVDSIVTSCKFAALYTFLDRDERRALAQANHESQTKHFSHCSGIFEKPADGVPLKTYIGANNYCSAAYIWITDERGNEIPTQVLDGLIVAFNGQERERLSGFQSRMGVRPLLPHPTLPNTKSQNLYYISYYPGRREANGLEQGMNFSRLDNYTIDFKFAVGAPQRMKINIIHREQNVIRFVYGMAGLVYATDPGGIFTEAMHRDREQAPSVGTQVVFENTDQPIRISEDERACMVTYENFAEGGVVQQCITCNKTFDSIALDNWLKTRVVKKCVHCQGPYNTTTFRKGKAHLTFDAKEEVPLLPIAEQRIGFVARLLQGIGFAVPVNPHVD